MRTSGDFEKLQRNLVRLNLLLIKIFSPGSYFKLILNIELTVVGLCSDMKLTAYYKCSSACFQILITALTTVLNGSLFK